jgi:hypothetical protein
MEARPKMWRADGVPAGLDRLIALQSAATPNEVGPPVAILEIDNDGKRVWIKNGMCDAGAGPPPKPGDVAPP